MTQSVVLLSSGLDSTVNLFWALQQSKVILTLTFDYGQRAASRETERAARISAQAGVAHKVLKLDWFKDFVRTSLVNRLANVPVGEDLNIVDQKTSEASAKAVWVPNRNGIFLNIAAGYAEGLGANWIIPGFNAEEAATFPDNSSAYARALDQSFSFSTAN
jgi:7-cyano-7-deazaguanine synthase